MNSMGAVEREKWQEALQERQEKVEAKIRESVKHDLERSIQGRAAAEVAARTAKVLNQAHSEIAAAENVHKKKIGELTRRLQIHEDRSGIHGDLPQLYSEMTDVCEHCQKLNRGFDDLRAHVSLQREDLSEALAYTEALMHNPDTLPGLRELVEALQRCQRRHIQSEKVGKELGLEPQNLALQELRDDMSRVAERCKRMADGTVNVRNGIQGEIEALRQDLTSVTKGLTVLHAGSERWVQRLEAGEHLVGQAQAQVNIRTDTAPPPLRPWKKSNLWDKMISGVFENFCATDRPMDNRTLPSSGSAPASPGQPQSMLRLAGAAATAKEEPAQSAASSVKGNPHLRKPKKSMAVSAYSKEALLRASQVFNLSIGDLVWVMPGKQVKGTVRFIGATTFAAGDWVGLELEGPYGKNDGTVNGEQYFECKPSHGLFLRPALCARASPDEAGKKHGSFVGPPRRVHKGVV